MQDSSPFSFKVYEPGTLTYEDGDACFNNTSVTELEPLPEKYKVLMIIGAQKAGTTWVWQALMENSRFVGAKEYDSCSLS